MSNRFLMPLIFCLLITALTAVAAGALTWRRVDSALVNGEIRRVSLDIRDNRKILIMTSVGLYSINMAAPTRNAVRLFGAPVNDVFIIGTSMLIATDQGLLSSHDDGKTWKQEIRDGIAYDITADDDGIFLATANGVYMRATAQLSWRKMPGCLGRMDARRLMVTENGLFILARQTLYFLPAGKDEAIKVFSRGTEEEKNVDIDPVETSEPLDDRPTDLVDIFPGYECIYLAAKDGVFVSADGGVSWRSLMADVEIPGEISAVVSVTDKDGRETICIGSSQGTSCGRPGHWVLLYEGMEDINIRSLSVLREKGLIAATRYGVYMLEDIRGEAIAAVGSVGDVNCVFEDYASVREDFVQEPTVMAVQAWAINYAEANKAKIDAWRRQARIKALLPSVSVGIDRTAGELFHWDTGPNPDALRKGRSSADWDLRLSWQLGDVLWSTDQTAIDSRSKLMVELREQVVDQVTRIYFERRRLQVELAACSYGNTGDRMAAEMRVDELTALLDGYTGGIFSKRIMVNSFNHQPRRDNL